MTPEVRAELQLRLWLFAMDRRLEDPLLDEYWRKVACDAVRVRAEVLRWDVK